MKGSQVRPKRWKDVVDLFDNGDFSIIWGKFDNIPKFGIRWNEAKTDKGFPLAAGHPVWFVIPDCFNSCLLSRIQNLIKNSNSLEKSQEEYLANLQKVQDAI